MEIKKEILHNIAENFGGWTLQQAVEYCLNEELRRIELRREALETPKDWPRCRWGQLKELETVGLEGYCEAQGQWKVAWKGCPQSPECGDYESEEKTPKEELRELQLEVKTLRDQIRRRNRQIRDLRKSPTAKK